MPSRTEAAFTGLLIVIPTRNRASLAINAIRSVLDQGFPDVRVLVSDNSTSDAELRTLGDHCAAAPDDRLGYMRPPVPLPMSQHWNWAIEQALEQDWASHFAILTDRMVIRPGEVAKLVAILRSFPGRVVSYSHDRIADHERPVQVQQHPWTGQLFEIESGELLRLAAGAVLHHPALPKMLNCAVPRTVLDTVRDRFGNIFDSIAPDFNFCFRCLAVEDGVIFYDKSALVHYALDRSNGMSFVRGIDTPDGKDFRAAHGAGEMRFFAPVPDAQTVGNVIFHEYCTVRRESGSRRFPDLDHARYLEYLAAEVEQLENEELRTRMRAILARDGWRAPSLASRLRRVASRAVQPGAAQTVMGKLVWLTTGPGFSRLWFRLARRLGVALPLDRRLGFESREAALDFALRSLPRRAQRPWHMHGRWKKVPAVLAPPRTVSRGSASALQGRT